VASQDRVFIERSVRIGIVAAIALAALLVLVYLLKAALTPLAAAFIIAYLFDPLIDRFEARRVKRSASITLLLVVMGGGSLLALAVVLPRLIGELGLLAQELPAYLERIADTLIPRFQELTGTAVPHTVSELLEQIRSGELELPLDALRDFLQGLLSFMTGTVSGVIGLLIVPILAYYALVEFDVLKRRGLMLVPPRHRAYVAEKARTVDSLVSGFLRGQLTIAVTLGVLYAIGFSLIGIDLAIGVGILAGAMALIPYLGNVVAVSAATGLCLLKFGVDIHLALVLGWYGIVQSLEGWYLTPRIMGRSVGLHPAVVIIALLIGADLLGLVGMLIAVPLVAVIKVFVGEAVTAYRESSFFEEEPPVPANPETGP
jgi:predicted PurR-regulated permease PerM